LPSGERPASVPGRATDSHQKILEEVYLAECAGDFEQAEAVLTAAIRQQASVAQVAHYLGELALVMLARGRYDELRALVEQMMTGADDLMRGSPFLYQNLEACRDIGAFLSAGNQVAEVPFRGHNLKFFISGQNSELEHYHVRELLYEPEEVDLILRFLKDGDTLLDIGANVGNHAIACATAVPGARIHVFEPVARCCELLRQNIALNNLTNIETGALGCAIGPVNGELRIIERINLASSRTTQREIGNLVAIRALRDLWPERVDFIKIDVEGLEVSILASVLDLVRRDGTRILLECHNATAETDLEKLTAMGLAPLARIQRPAVVNLMVGPVPED